MSSREDSSQFRASSRPNRPELRSCDARISLGPDQKARKAGQRLLERLLKARWLEPTACADGRVYFAENDIHQALRRLQKSGVELNGHARPIGTARKKKRVTSTDPLADLAISIDELL